MAQAKPARRRIVPEQILSPTKSQADTESLNLTAAGPRLELGDLKEHSAVAAELLGAGRKIYIDLAAYQRSEKEVDWKEVRCFSALARFDQISCSFQQLSLFASFFVFA